MNDPKFARLKQLFLEARSLAPDHRCVLTGESKQRPWWKFGGACPVDQFRLASEAARRAGGVAAALAQVEADLAAASPNQRPALETLRNRLLELGAR